jgi:FKBP-type peptidyl-prolyl cis-trans isomerase (trigger factor)
MKIAPVDETIDGGDGYHRINVEADWSEMSDDYDNILTEFMKVSVPGFRPGKTPKTIIEKRFQKEIIADLSQRAAQRIGREAIWDAGIEALGPVEAEEIECAKGQLFKAMLRFHPMPKIELPDINSLKIDDRGADPRDQISLRLLELVRFDVPEKLVRDELDLDGICDAIPGSPQWTADGDRIKLLLILKQIAPQEGIEIDDADINNRITEKAKEFGTTTRSLRKELEKGGGLQRLADMLIAESTLEYLMEKNRCGNRTETHNKGENHEGENRFQTKGPEVGGGGVCAGRTNRERRGNDGSRRGCP